MKTHVKFLGLDVHKDDIVPAVAESGRNGEVRVHQPITSDLHSVERLITRLRKDGSAIKVAYEAGPTGFGLARHLHTMGIECLVVAPSKMPIPAGKRQKTDRRDAELLARLLRADELTSIAIPGPVDESIRDLMRARSDAVDDLRRAKQRLKSFLLRQGYRYSGSADWGAPHLRYLRGLTLPLPAHKAVLEEYLMAFDGGVNRIARLDDLIATLVPQWVRYPLVKALMNFRGVKLIAASVLVAEIGDIRRFKHPRDLMAFLGLVPHERSTGQSRRLGGITKAGNVHARWMMVEVVQSASQRPKVSPQLTERQLGQPAERRELAWKAQTRLWKRSWRLLDRKVLKHKVTVALAREMAGFVWAMLHLVPEPSADGPGLRRA